MMTATDSTTTDSTTDMSRGDQQAVARRFTGEALEPGEPGYDEGRRIWNGLHDDVEPALVVRAASVEDVQRTVTYARASGLPLAVRGGGHNVAGTATTEGGIVLDLGELRTVEVDVETRRARVAAGATWGDVDVATQAHGLAAPGGVVSDTGVGGLTLGGGIGWLRRRHGLTCDNLVGAQLVTADGEVREVTEDDELLWGLRGGGGGLGVVTRFDFQLHEVGPEVSVAWTLYHGHRARDVLASYRELTTELDRDVSSFAILGTVPDDEEFPEATWGEPYAMLMACACTADPETGAAHVRPFTELGDRMLDLSGTMAYVDLQQALDADYPSGNRYYWSSLHLPALSDEALDLAVARWERRASTTSTLDLWHLGGAMADLAPQDTAFGDRSDTYLLGAEANWVDPATDSANVRWARDTVASFRPHSSGRTYLNFPGFYEGGDAMRRSVHGRRNHRRLERLRDAVDPEGILRPVPPGRTRGTGPASVRPAGDVR